MAWRMVGRHEKCGEHAIGFDLKVIARSLWTRRVNMVLEAKLGNGRGNSQQKGAKHSAYNT